jgi:hypothetical protein
MHMFQVVSIVVCVSALVQLYACRPCRLLVLYCSIDMQGRTQSIGCAGFLASLTSLPTMMWLQLHSLVLSLAAAARLS